MPVMKRIIRKIRIAAIWLFSVYIVGCSRNSENPASEVEPIVVTSEPEADSAAVTVPATQWEAESITATVPADLPEATDTLELSGVTPLGIKIMYGSKSQDETDYIFISDKEGWQASYDMIGMSQQNITLYKTEDSGLSWTKLTSTFDDEYSIPLATKSGLFFIDSLKGWITTETPQEGFIGLYQTLDGGITWKQQSLEVPKEYSRVMFGTYPPVFFSLEDGLLLTYFYGDYLGGQAPDQAAYATHDSGETWNLIKEKEDDILQWSMKVDTEGNFRGYYVTYYDDTWYTSDRLTWKNTKQSEGK